MAQPEVIDLTVDSPDRSAYGDFELSQHAFDSAIAESLKTYAVEQNQRHQKLQDDEDEFLQGYSPEQWRREAPGNATTFKNSSRPSFPSRNMQKHTEFGEHAVSHFDNLKKYLKR
ncbi:MAG: hypothetical protein M1814_001059 [Vezdaea aestivalis]|nr:MAG: hypothetical protein M1814_001059 [Vezdaea aestivalis]